LKAGEYTGKQPKTAVRLAEKAPLQAISAATRNPVGAGLARDDAVSVKESVDCQALIAGKPGSHRFYVAW
jgi:hypothetical protein